MCLGLAGLLACSAVAACRGSEWQAPGDVANEIGDTPHARGRVGALLEVDVLGRRVRMATPEAEPAHSPGGPNFSILEGRSIGLEIRNYTVSAPGEFRAGKVRVRFDVSVSNLLPGVVLVPPALGGAAAPARSLMLFPILQSGTLTTGTTTVTDDGSVLVDRGLQAVVEPSEDWDGEGTPSDRQGFDFAGDSICTIPAPGCSRWEALSPLASGASSASHSVGFDLDPTVAGFRAWLLLAADIRGDTTSTPSPPPPPPPSGQGIPFGPFGLAVAPDTGAAVESFTLGHDGYTASSIIHRIVAARARRQKLVLALTGGAHDNYLTDGVFDRAKWETKMDTYKSATIQQVVAEAVADGTIVGASVMDEPHVSGEGDGNTWGPRGTMTKARVDSLCGYVKAMFPTLPVGVAERYDLFEPDKSYRVCEFTMSQYSAVAGSVAAFRDGGLAMARRDGHEIMFSLNIINGGPQAAWDGRWDCPPESGGRGQYAPNCRMTAQQLRDWALVLGPAGCGGLLMWRYDSAYMSDPDNQSAFREIAARLAAMTARPCRAPAP